MQRDLSIDALKGVGIILVLAAHSLGGYVGTFSYSFHMPLFFLVSGYLHKPRGAWEELRHDARRLLVPFIFAYAVVLAAALATSGTSLNFSSAGDVLATLRTGNPIGNLWFLVALLWAKSLFNVISRAGQWWSFAICLTMGAAAYIVGQRVNAPYKILEAIAVLPFLWIGWKARREGTLQKPANWWLLAPMAAIWLCTTREHSLDVGSLYFRYWYMGNIALATTGTCVVYLLCRLICSHRPPLGGKQLAFIGRISLLLIVYPTIETYVLPMQSVVPAMPMHTVAVVLAKVAWLAFWVWATFKVKPLRCVFGL